MTKTAIIAPMKKRVVILASHGVQALDVTGPASVFSGANQARPGKEPYIVDVISPEGGLVETVSGVTLNAKSVSKVSPRKVDTLLIAGHDRGGTEKLISNQRAKRWVTNVTRTARRWGSVCSGTFPLAAWGLLNGKKVATHWFMAQELADRYEKIQVDPDSLFVVDGDIWTSAGVTAGIDMSLSMVEADLGPDLAADIARHLVVYLRRPGSQSQFSRPLKTQCATYDPYADLIAWAKTNLHNDLTIETLAAKAGQSPRTFQRRFAEQVGRTPAAFFEELRLDRAKALIMCDVPLQAVASEIGYPSSSQLTSAFRRRLGIAPSVWKAMHCGKAIGEL